MGDEAVAVVAVLDKVSMLNLSGSIHRQVDAIACKGGARPTKIRANAAGIGAALAAGDGSSNLSASRAHKAVEIVEDASLPAGTFAIE